MIFKTDGAFVGRRSGSTDRGTWYGVSLVIEGEAENYNCNKIVYDKCQDMSIGAECIVSADVRRYGRDWSIRINDLEFLIDG